MKFTQEMIDKKLREIQESIPKEWLEFDEKLKTPTLNFLADKIVKDKKTKENVRIEVERLIRLGTFSQKERDLSEDKKKKINEFLDAKLRQAIARGELPPPSRSPFMKKLRVLKKI